jgi:hypothetical protein
MTADEFRAEQAFDQSLKAGQVVTVHWTWRHGWYQATATVVRVNRASVVVAIGHDVPSAYTRRTVWAQGHHITVPRFMAVRWTASNRVAPPAPAPTYTNETVATGGKE